MISRRLPSVRASNASRSASIPLQEHTAPPASEQQREREPAGWREGGKSGRCSIFRTCHCPCQRQAAIADSPSGSEDTNAPRWAPPCSQHAPGDPDDSSLRTSEGAPTSAPFMRTPTPASNCSQSPSPSPLLSPSLPPSGRKEGEAPLLSFLVWTHLILMPTAACDLSEHSPGMCGEGSAGSLKMIAFKLISPGTCIISLYYDTQRCYLSSKRLAHHSNV